MRSTLALFLFISVFIFACRPPEDPTALITVFDAEGSVKPDVYVRLYTEGDNGDGIYNLLDSTDASGKAIFNFTDVVQPGQKGFVVFQVRTILTGNDSTEHGVIVVKDEGISEKQITLD